MARPRTDAMYLVSGLVLILYAIYAFVAGKVLTLQLEFVTPAESVLDYYVNTVGLALMGAALTYRSLLFIPGNREYHARPDQTQDGPYDVDPARTAGWAVFAALVFAVILVVYGWVAM